MVDPKRGVIIAIIGIGAYLWYRGMQKTEEEGTGHGALIPAPTNFPFGGVSLVPTQTEPAPTYTTTYNISFPPLQPITFPEPTRFFTQESVPTKKEFATYYQTPEPSPTLRTRILGGTTTMRTITVSRPLTEQVLTELNLKKDIFTKGRIGTWEVWRGDAPVGTITAKKIAIESPTMKLLTPPTPAETKKLLHRGLFDTPMPEVVL